MNGWSEHKPWGFVNDLSCRKGAEGLVIDWDYPEVWLTCNKSEDKGCQNNSQKTHNTNAPVEDVYFLCIGTELATTNTKHNRPVQGKAYI